MKLFLLAISAFWLLIGITSLLSPSKIKQFYARIIKPAKTLCFLPLIAGVLFLWSAPASSLPTFIRVLAAISFLKAIFLLACPYSFLKSFMDRILSLPQAFYRVEGLFIMALGAVVAWSVM